jgi:Protein of unknown function (DUF3048) N-terminal domain/Protein of unknown function (DUF3048) C-terminal domain
MPGDTSQPTSNTIDLRAAAVPPPAAATPVKPYAEAAKSSGQNLTPPWYKQPRLLTIVGGAALVLVAGVGFAMHQMMAKKPAPVAAVKPSASPTPSPTPTAYYSPLTGLPVSDAATSQLPVVGVMIENLYPDARPQSGLTSAGIVYEALAEGGITRFMGIFQQPFPGSLGPVRSLRPYYLDWGLEHDIPVAHAGGSEPALNAIKPLGLKDINALTYDGSYFIRTRDRYAPHNLYSTADLLDKVLTKLGFATAPTFKPMERKADMPPQAATHPVINIPFSTSPYSVKYQYDGPTDSYLRVMGGAPHIDRNTNQQIKVKNIVVLYIPVTYGIQPVDKKPETDYHLIGSGKAQIFVDGGETDATWSKADDHAPTNLTGADGKPIQFNRGNTWFEAVPTGTAVTF